MKPQVSVITLGVRDFARARDFYVERLGWPVQQEDDDRMHSDRDSLN